MPVENTTANRGYQLPDGTNNLDVDVLRIIAALEGIDGDAATLFASLSGKAAVSHTHAIADVSLLQAALDAKASTNHGHGIADVTSLQASLDAKAPIASPTFTGSPISTTASAGDNSTRIATTAWVRLQGYLTAIADGSITVAKLATDAVETAKIKDAAVTFAKMASGAVATTTEFLAATASKILTADQVWGAGVPVPLTYGATMALDMATFVNAKITATGNITFGATSNVKKGQMGIVEITHSGGARTLSLNTTYHQAVGGSITLAGTSGQVEKLAYYVADNGKVEWSLIGVAS